MDLSTEEDLDIPEGYSLAEDEEEDFSLPEGYSIAEEDPETSQEQEEDIGLLRKFFRYVGERELREAQTAEQKARGQLIVGKGAASGVTLGASEYIPGFEAPTDEKERALFSTGDLIGSAAPIAGITNVVGKGATKLAQKSPFLKETIQSVLTLFGAGTTYHGAENLIKNGQIDPIDSVIHGSAWVALHGALKVAGLTAMFADKLAQKASFYKVPRDYLINQVVRLIESSGIKFATEEEMAQYALEALDSKMSSKTIEKGQRVFQERLVEPAAQYEASKEAGNRMKFYKVKDESIVNLDKDAQILSKNITPKNLDVSEEVDNLAKSSLRKDIDQVGTRAMTEEETGDFIKAAIDLEIEDAMLAVKPFYDSAKEKSRFIKTNMSRTGNRMANQLEEITSLMTRPENYSKAIGAYENALSDLGAVIQRDAEGLIESIVFEDVSLDKVIELTQRLNKIIKYDLVDKNIVNTLEKYVKSLKNEIEIALKSDAEALAAYQLAEEEYRNIGGKFKGKTVRKIRGTEEGEKIAKSLDSPHAMRELKKALREEEYVELERQMLEKLEDKGHEQAQKYYNKMKGEISKENQKLAEEIIRSKNPNNPEVRKKLAHKEILEDVGEALNSGTRPEKTLKLWQTPRGAKVVKKAFEGSPNWPKVKQYLENQTFADMIKTVVTKGELNGIAVRDLMKNQQFRESIKSMGGKDALQFFETLDKRVDLFRKQAEFFFGGVPSKDMWRRIERGLEKAEKDTAGQELLKVMVDETYPLSEKFRRFENWISDKLGFSGKQIMSIYGVSKLMSNAGVKGLVKPVASMVVYKFLKKLAMDRAFRNKFVQVTKEGIDPILYIKLIGELGEALNEE